MTSKGMVLTSCVLVRRETDGGCVLMTRNGEPVFVTRQLFARVLKNMKARKVMLV